jgi:hypothetical protein
MDRVGGDELAGGLAGDGGGTGAGIADRGLARWVWIQPGVMAAGGPDVPAGRRPGWGPRGFAGRWLVVFCVSLGLFAVRLLVPTPVGQADNHDGPRLVCGGLGVGPVTGGHARFFLYAYFTYVPHAACARITLYPSAELVPLAVARLLTPLSGLSGALNLIVLGVLFCVIASAGIASLAAGLRLRLWAQLLVAAAAWLIMADAAFFDTFASPFSEPAALAGLLLVAAGVIYLGRGGRATVFGLALAGAGGFLAIAAKEQYVMLAVPVCLTLVLASANWGRRGGLGRLATRQAAAAMVVAGLLAATAAAYVAWDYTSRYGARLHHEQAVDMIFTDIVTRRATAPADLRALGLPVSWAKYAGRYYWQSGSVRHDPLYARYAARLSDANIAHFLLTHPGSILSIGQKAADLAQHVHVTTLGNYSPGAGHPPGAAESRVLVLTWLARQLPPRLGLLWLVPLWAAMAAVAITALRLQRGHPWRRDGAVLVLCMTGCATAAFIPPAYFAGISTTRHMASTNLATALALTITIALAISMTWQALPRPPRPPPEPSRHRQTPEAMPSPRQTPPRKCPGRPSDLSEPERPVSRISDHACPGHCVTFALSLCFFCKVTLLSSRGLVESHPAAHCDCWCPGWGCMALAAHGWHWLRGEPQRPGSPMTDRSLVVAEPAPGGWYGSQAAGSRTGDGGLAAAHVLLLVP